MAGRGRGRGFRANFSLDSDQPTSCVCGQVLEQKPLPLSGGEQVEYLLALKQEFRGASRNLPSFLQTKVQRRDVERYSDKYHSPDQDQDQDWTPGKTRDQDILYLGLGQIHGENKVQRLLILMSTHSDEEEEEEEEKKGEEEEGEEEQIEEDEFEEETDYIMSYFDNGEEFGADSDDNMDEAIY
uniref:DNA-directed RNA polymerase III subunit n=1 Tax=Periophthalmus magnuspinnatus TaxID=409849 RepID=A0A3B3ZLW5_9GOBI